VLTTEIISSNPAADLSNILYAQSVEAYSIVLDLDKEKPPHALESVEIWCDSEFLKKTNATILDLPGLGLIDPYHKKL
jgi:hypothetical protein